MAAFATKAELEQVKEEQKRMATRIEGIDASLTRLHTAVAELVERTDRRFDAMEARLDERDAALDARLDALVQLIEDGKPSAYFGRHGAEKQGRRLVNASERPPAVSRMSASLDRIDAKLDVIDAKVDALGAKIDRGFDMLTSLLREVLKK